MATFKHNTTIYSNNQSINTNKQKNTVTRGLADNNGLKNIRIAQENCDEPLNIFFTPLTSNTCDEPSDYPSSLSIYSTLIP